MSSKGAGDDDDDGSAGFGCSADASSSAVADTEESRAARYSALVQDLSGDN